MTVSATLADSSAARLLRDTGRRQMDRLTLLRLTDPELDFWVDLRLRQFGGRWLAAADLAA